MRRQEKEVIRDRMGKAEPVAEAGTIFRVLRLWSGPGR
jgi:hypothetical protein